MSRITVFTNFRCASTWFTKTLARIHQITHLDEFFHHSGRAVHGPKNHFQNLTCVQRTDNWVVKVMGTQLAASPVDKLDDELAACSDQIYFLLRKDFDAQVRSWYIANTLKDHHAEWDDEKLIPFNRGEYLLAEQQLKNSTMEIYNTYKKYKSKGKLLWTENVIVAPVPYHRPVKLTKEPPKSYFYPEKIFSK